MHAFLWTQSYLNCIISTANVLNYGVNSDSTVQFAKMCARKDFCGSAVCNSLIAIIM